MGHTLQWSMGIPRDSYKKYLVVVKSRRDLNIDAHRIFANFLVLPAACVTLFVDIVVSFACIVPLKGR